ncbi:MAG: hypothetical protein J6T27_02315 [Alphaproteobacteria bacterium]|nr:hypothetical protein [Alphaproteobacteria bacterium]
MLSNGKCWLASKDWQDYLNQRQIEEENKLEYGEEVQFRLLADIYTLVFRIHRHVEKTTNEMNLLKILLAVLFYSDISQADIAKLYGIPIGTIGNIVAKYSSERITKGGHIKNTGKIDEANILFEIIPDKTKKNRKILKLTERGIKKAQDMLQFMVETLDNMKTVDNKSPSVKYNYLKPIVEPLSRLCRYTTGTNDTLKILTEKNRPTRKGL